MVTFLEDPKSGAHSRPDKIWWFLIVLTQEWRMEQMAVAGFSEILIELS